MNNDQTKKPGQPAQPDQSPQKQREQNDPSRKSPDADQDSSSKQW